jgi:hypothetical protein
MFVHNFFLVNRVKIPVNLSHISQNLTQYQSKVISKFPQSKSHFGNPGI